MKNGIHSPMLGEMSMMLEWGNWIATREQAEALPKQPELDLRCCSSAICSGEQWRVQLISVDNQLWRVSSTNGAGSYLVAGNTPACPFCGGDLPA